MLRPARHIRLPIFFRLIALSASVPLASAQSSSPAIPNESQLDAIVSASPDHPGVVVAVIRDGAVAVAKAYGLATLSPPIPFTIQTRSNLGSTSKQFTAFAIALLAAEKKLSLDDDIRRFIPELPDIGGTVTLRHLLTHTSGFREMFTTRLLAGHGLEDSFARPEILRIVQRQPALQNSPGGEWSYNNTGYALLALVVERVTATPFPRWMQAHVFSPIGMNDTVVRASPDDDIPHSARGYLRTENGYREARDLSAAIGAGAIYTTVEDLARWMGNFKSGAVGGHDVFAQMSAPAIPTGFGNTAYGLGLYLDEWHGLRRVYHHGDDVAHHSAFFYFPDHDVGVVVETNDSSFNAVRVGTRIAEAVFASHLASANTSSATPPAVSDPTRFNRYTGSYESEKTPGLIYTFSHDRQRFWVAVAGEKMELTPLDGSRFRVKGQNVELAFAAEEMAPASTVTIFNRGEEKAHRVAAQSSAPDPTPHDLTPYAGRYESSELETFYTFAVQGNTLALLHPRFSQPITLKHVAGERFRGNDPVASVVFERDTQNRISGFRVGNGSGYEYIAFTKTSSPASTPPPPP